jgi:hypothetical protein
MGSSKETVKGQGKKKDGNNLVTANQKMLDEVEECLKTKKEDLLNEGASSRKENERKIELLENVRNMYIVTEDLLESY